MRQIIVALILFFSLSPATAQTRILLVKDSSFYVGLGGNDERDCLSASTACATLQHVVDKLRQQYDLGCRKATINVLPGSVIEGAYLGGPQVGQCKRDDFLIIGDTTKTWANATNLYPYNRTITSTIAGDGGARFRVEGLRLTTTAGPALSADDGGTRVETGFVDFGPVGSYHMVAGVFARLKVTNHITVSGSADGLAQAPIGQFQILFNVTVIFVTSETNRVHWRVAGISATEVGKVNLNWGAPSVPPANRTRFWNANGFECSQTVTCATGSRWAAALGSMIYTGGGSIDPYWLPGDQPGWTAPDSIYN